MTTDPDRVATARALLEHLGVTAADLTDSNRPAVPTVAEYLPAVVAAASPATRRTYGSSWRRMAAAYGDRRIDAVRASDIEALMRQAPALAVTPETAGTPASTSSPPPAPSTTAPSPTVI
ncbi:hypothetical protein OG400_29755 [Micromonospora ureilytica]|uniref:hypothetical protein n=1 Tax=Micromonospora ureilytica TaxID=709868 RepID=UPI002E0D0E85|nr:hypothetical protein OG400_29755 [Micromonospora ureilytica]